jgi:beta-galactosidase
MFDYSGDFTSLYTRFSETGYYSYGILDDEVNLNRIAYNVIKSKQTNGKRITIPIGIKQDDAPLFIIFTGLVLAIFMGLLINSKKKFRKDATRALLRPYNFFADIRDHRIISGFHTILLMIILAGSHALLLVNLLFYLKNNILLEKILLAFGVQSWIHIFSYLAWNPVTAFIYTFILSIIMFFCLAIIIKGASFFIKTKVLITNIYYVVIWAFLPMTILLPVKLILYRLLITESFNLYIYIFLIIYLIWIVGRVLKGVYVIFDVNKGTVYFYSIVMFLIIFSGMLFYFQFTNSTIYYIINAFKQYQFM